MMSQLLKDRARRAVKLALAAKTAKTYYMDEIGHYIYAGDTALHVAAALPTGMRSCKS